MGNRNWVELVWIVWSIYVALTSFRSYLESLLGINPSKIEKVTRVFQCEKLKKITESSGNLVSIIGA